MPFLRHRAAPASAPAGSGLLSPAGAATDEIREKTLDNGLKALVMTKPGTPVVAVQVWYRAGSRNEHPGIRGIAHLFEHMMFRGSEHYGPEEHMRLIQELGGAPNASTSEDHTVYHERLPAHGLELALKLEAERMHLLKLSDEVLNTERRVVMEEFRMALNSPMGDVFLKVPPMLYPNHPYGWTPLGNMADLESLSIADCREFYGRCYAPNNAVLVIVGDVNVDTALKLVEQHFGDIPAKPALALPDLALAPQPGIRRFREKARLPVLVTGIAFRIPEARHPDLIPLQVLSSILSAGESGRLNKALVREKELAVAALGLPLVHQGPGYFVYVAIHLPGTAHEKVERALRAEIDRLKTEDVSDEELEKARNQLLAGRTFERYSALSLAYSIGDAEVVKGDYRLYQRDVEEVGKVTKADVRRVAISISSPPPRRLSTLTPSSRT